MIVQRCGDIRLTALLLLTGYLHDPKISYLCEAKEYP